MSNIGKEQPAQSVQIANSKPPRGRPRLLTVLGPGLLVAATGVGAGDLATGAFTGVRLGLTILWAVAVGAALKFVINEGLARWQLATGTTFLEGAVRYLGAPVRVIFPVYLVLWSYLVCAALMGACGVAAHAILPLNSVDPEVAASLSEAALADAEEAAARTDKIIYGILHSVVAVGLVLWGGYRVFERIMSVCIAVMFVTVVISAFAVQPSLREIGAGLVPSVPRDFDTLRWTIALIGGIGGTLTVLCYGYWIREAGRLDMSEIRTCRIDLGLGYVMTGVFGVCMVILGSQITADGRGARLVVQLAMELEDALGTFGTAGRWMFLLGAWGAIFSSLLGVWQAVPYLFADYRRIVRLTRTGTAAPVSTSSRDYRVWLFAIATVPALGLLFSFESQQLVYAVVGALCIPLLGIALLLLNAGARYIGGEHRNSWVTNVVLLLALGFFLVYGWLAIEAKRAKPPAPQPERTALRVHGDSPHRERDSAVASSDVRGDHR